MNRLIQGDVGCGKTVVAIVALLVAVENGAQGVLMAPTEILAEQHYLTLKGYFDRLGIHIEFLTSSVRKKERQAVLQSIRSGEAHVVIGTHSLIQEDVSFSKLSLAIIDEQHKFGVMQRALLRRKGYRPDILIMTATPIPRTLALSVYGDLDISIIDQLPPGRNPIQTKIVYESQRYQAYQTIQNELNKGRQAYVVVPLVEESEKVDLKAAISMAQVLQKDFFPNQVVGLLHGRMSPEERASVMKNFKDGMIQLLVTTTVIEVGIDVSNASVMMIDHAERFGLSQLHQLRGRIGRGPHPSFCILLAQYPLSEDAKRRLSAMAKYQDGFSIAEEDLSIRGPGEFLGTRQSGIPELRVASIIRDAKILEKTRKEAFQLLEMDPELSFPDHQGLRQQLERRWQDKLELMNLG
jgi:ATP-dependent DNA helicase RecG